MSDAARKLMEADEFLVWCQTQEDSYELIDGMPVLKYGNGPEAMAGGTRRHADIVQNIFVALRLRLRGGPCAAFLGDLFAVRTAIRKQRRPDVFVECGRGAEADLEATAPTILFQVLSPSSSREDLVLKPEEYKRLPTVRQYVVVDPEAALLKVWTRDLDGRWDDGVVAGLEAALPLPALDLELPLAEIYAGVDLTTAA